MNQEAPSIPFEQLPEADLCIGTVYRSGTAPSFGSDPISKLVGGGNRGGFRYKGKTAVPGLRFVVLFTTLNESEWPDRFDRSGRQFIYYGDNRSPGQELHETPKRGNLVLREIFHAMHAGDRSSVPPILVFSRWRESRDVLFEGLAVPGSPELDEEQDLTAFWKTHGDQRFLNYRAVFTMLQVSTFARSDVEAMKSGSWLDVAPSPWSRWAQLGNLALGDLPPVPRPWLTTGAE